MSIYIKRMEMPENCIGCIFTSPINDYSFNSICKFTRRECVGSGRNEDCPLTEVSEPHGDLVDHSEIGEILIKALDECEISEADKGHVIRAVWTAPTVIERSET